MTSNTAFQKTQMRSAELTAVAASRASSRRSTTSAAAAPMRRVRRTLLRLAATWREFDHAQRRLFEINTGVIVTKARPTAR
jgi:type IV secretory pathway TrbL component